MINRENTNYKIIILWGPGDEQDIRALKEKNYDNTAIITPASLRELASIIYNGDVLISNDSGVRHIAQALGLKTIGLFGPTNDKSWAYTGKNNIVLTDNIDCRPCDKTKCKDRNDECMNNIKPETVFGRLKTFF